MYVCFNVEENGGGYVAKIFTSITGSQKMKSERDT